MGETPLVRLLRILGACKIEALAIRYRKEFIFIMARKNVPDTGLYMETTTKDPEDTLSEIRKHLKKYDLTKFHETYYRGELTGCIFSVNLMGKDTAFSLPINWKPLLAKADRGETKYIKSGDVVQAQRVAWRQVLRWIESQLALIDVGMASFQEVFLPYLMVSRTKTLYETLEDANFNLNLLNGPEEK